MSAIGTCRYLIFVIGDEEYAMPIDRIREIIGYVPVVPFSKNQGMFQGIVPWKDDLIPVMDLRVTVRNSDALTTQHTCIVVMDLPVDGEMVLAGMVVDGVVEIVEMPTGVMDNEVGFSFAERAPSLSWGSVSGRRQSVLVNRNPKHERL